MNAARMRALAERAGELKASVGLRNASSGKRKLDDGRSSEFCWIDDVLQELQPSVVLETSFSVDSSCVDQPFQKQGTQSDSTLSHAQTSVSTFDAVYAAAHTCAVPDRERIDDMSVTNRSDSCCSCISYVE